MLLSMYFSLYNCAIKLNLYFYDCALYVFSSNDNKLGIDLLISYSFMIFIITSIQINKSNVIV